MVNQATVARLQSGPVPPDLQCVLPQETADAIAQVINVTGLASQISSGGVSTPVTNTIGQQALTLATANQLSIQALQGLVVERRVVAIRQNVNAGDSVQAFAISPAMPNSDYEVRVTLFGPATHPGAYYAWRLVSGSQTVNGFQLSFDNLPASSLATVVVENLQSIQTP